MGQGQNTAAFLEQQHQDYLARQHDWNFYRQSYIGGSEYITGRNLFSHRLEHRTDAARRQQRSYFLNHCRTIVDRMTALLFEKGFEITPEPPLYLMADADRRGNNLIQLARRAATLSSIYGNIFIRIDVPRAGEILPKTRLEELEMGLRPYLDLVDPGDVLNWEVDEGGALTWCLTREPLGLNEVTGGSRPVQSEGQEIVYRLWTREGWYLFAKRKGQWKAIDEGVHNLGLVPLVSLKHRSLDAGPCGESMLRDVGIINREIYNLSSLLQEIIYRQTFGQLVAQGSSDEYVGEEETLAKLGTSSIFLYPDGREAPSYISPNTENADVILQQIDRMIVEIYRISNLNPPESLAQRTQPESGIAHAYRLIDTAGTLRDKSDGLASALETALWIASVWEGSEQIYSIKFPEFLNPPAQ